MSKVAHADGGSTAFSQGPKNVLPPGGGLSSLFLAHILGTCVSFLTYRGAKCVCCTCPNACHRDAQGFPMNRLRGTVSLMLHKAVYARGALSYHQQHPPPWASPVWPQHPTSLGIYLNSASFQRKSKPHHEYHLCVPFQRPRLGNSGSPA